MSGFVVLVLCSLSTCAGYLLGVTLRNLAFESQPWLLLRWDKHLLAYRSVPDDYTIKTSDKIMMSLELDPDFVELKQED